MHTSFMYMAIGSSIFAPRAKAVVGAVGAEQHVAATRRRGRRPRMSERADPLRLGVVGVVVAGGERVGAEHDAALHLGAEPGVRVGAFMASTSSPSTRSP